MYNDTRLVQKSVMWEDQLFKHKADPNVDAV